MLPDSPEMVVTFDETAIKTIPTDDWTVEEQGLTQVPIISAVDKRPLHLDLLSLEVWKCYKAN